MNVLSYQINLQILKLHCEAVGISCPAETISDSDSQSIVLPRPNAPFGTGRRQPGYSETECQMMKVYLQTRWLITIQK